MGAASCNHRYRHRGDAAKTSRIFFRGFSECSTLTHCLGLSSLKS